MCMEVGSNENECLRHPAHRGGPDGPRAVHPAVRVRALNLVRFAAGAVVRPASRRASMQGAPCPEVPLLGRPRLLLIHSTRPCQARSSRILITSLSSSVL